MVDVKSRWVVWVKALPAYTDAVSGEADQQYVHCWLQRTEEDSFRSWRTWGWCGAAVIAVIRRQLQRRRHWHWRGTGCRRQRWCPQLVRLCFGSRRQTLWWRWVDQMEGEPRLVRHPSRLRRTVRILPVSYVLIMALTSSSLGFPTSSALYFTPVISFFLFCFLFYSSATIGTQRTELNQTVPHVGKWARFEKCMSKIWGVSFPEKLRPKSYRFFYVSDDSKRNGEYFRNKTLRRQSGNVLETTKGPVHCPEIL